MHLVTYQLVSQTHKGLVHILTQLQRHLSKCLSKYYLWFFLSHCTSVGLFSKRSGFYLRAYSHNLKITIACSFCSSHQELHDGGDWGKTKRDKKSYATIPARCKDVCTQRLYSSSDLDVTYRLWPQSIGRSRLLEIRFMLVVGPPRSLSIIEVVSTPSS